jgi:hypothetical protein
MLFVGRTASRAHSPIICWKFEGFFTVACIPKPIIGSEGQPPVHIDISAIPLKRERVDYGRWFLPNKSHHMNLLGIFNVAVLPEPVPRQINMFYGKNEVLESIGESLVECSTFD